MTGLILCSIVVPPCEAIEQSHFFEIPHWRSEFIRRLREFPPNTGGRNPCGKHFSCRDQNPIPIQLAHVLNLFCDFVPFFCEMWSKTVTWFVVKAFKPASGNHS